MEKAQELGTYVLIHAEPPYVARVVRDGSMFVAKHTKLGVTGYGTTMLEALNDLQVNLTLKEW